MTSGADTKQDRTKRLVFEGFEFDPQRCQLWCNGAEVPLEPRVLDLLSYLATRPGQLVRKADLLEGVWKAKTLSDGVLSNTIGKLRRALGQDIRENAPIETVRGRGYRWRAVPLASPPTATDPEVPLRPADAGDGEPQAPSFVGRSAVLDLFAQAIARGTGLLLVAGEAGIGKTCALTELSRLARAQGFTVWRAAAYEGAGAPAYWPWVEVLRAAHADLGAAIWRRYLPAQPLGLGRLVPEFVVAEGESTSDGPAARFRVFDEVTRWLAASSGNAPRLIVLDDLHWADPASVELLAFAVRSLGKDQRHVLFAAGVRDRDTSLTHAQRTALQRIERIATHIPLSGLDASELAEFVGRASACGGARLLQAPREARVLQALHRRTQGNPFFVLQILGWLAQRGLPADVATIESGALPAAVEGVIRQRVALLGEPARATLSAAAVIGDEFDASVLARVLERPVDQTLRAIEPARHLGVIERKPGSEMSFRFSHTLLREVLYAELAWADCGLLHAKLARTLAVDSACDDVRRLGEIARHALLAVPGELASAVAACRVAAAAAREASGFEVAAELLVRALKKLEAEAGDDATRCELLLTLGFDQFCCGELAAATRTLERGAAVARSRGDAVGFAGFACRIADWQEFGVDDQLARALVEQALAGLAPGEVEQRAMLLARQAKLDDLRSAQERRALFEEAEQLATRSAVPSVMIDVAFCRASLRDPTQAEASRVATARYRALVVRHPEHGRSVRDRMRLVSADVTDYFAALAVADIDAADHTLARCAAAARNFQVPPLSMIAELAGAGRMLALGKLEELDQTLARAADGALDPGSPGMALSLYALPLAEARGQLDAYRSLVLPELPRGAQPFSERHHMVRDLWAAWLYARTGRLAAAHDALRMLSPAAIQRMPVRYGDLGALCILAEVYCALADHPAAQRLYAQLTPHAELNAVGMLADCKGSVAHYLGMLADLLGDVTAAVRWLRQAEAINRRLKMPLLLARTSALLAQCEAARSLGHSALERPR